MNKFKTLLFLAVFGGIGLWGCDDSSSASSNGPDENAAAESFFINFADGSIYPNPDYDEIYKQKCWDTIEALQLDRPECRKMRKRHFKKYADNKVTLDDLKEDSPFVYQEIVRQGL